MKRSLKLRVWPSSGEMLIAIGVALSLMLILRNPNQNEGLVWGQILLQGAQGNTRFSYNKSDDSDAQRGSTLIASGPWQSASQLISELGAKGRKASEVNAGDDSDSDDDDTADTQAERIAEVQRKYNSAKMGHRLGVFQDARPARKTGEAPAKKAAAEAKAAPTKSPERPRILIGWGFGGGGWKIG